MSENIVSTLEFLKTQLPKSRHYIDYPAEMEYRIRHSIRVANIGAEIAKNENMNVEAMTIACLLHDISYMNEFNSEADWKNHGRTSASISRKYLEDINIDENLKEEICYGIAIHVDDESDFEGVRTPFAETIGDSDNIDRFDVYRIYENLQNSNFNGLTHEEQLNFVVEKIDRIRELEKTKLGSVTATNMWLERLSYQLDFFNKLKKQLKNGEVVNTI
jgi:uncharacterized protein